MRRLGHHGIQHPAKTLQSLLAITLITTLCPSAPAAAQEGAFANNNAPISEQNSLQSEPDAQQLQSNAVDITNPGDFHVGYGSESSSDIPYASFSNYGLTETLYSADDLKDAGCSKDTITSIAFNVIEADMLETTSVKIYFGLTNDNSLSQFVDANNLTLVYEGSPTIGKIEGWEEIKLDKPFEYDGPFECGCRRGQSPWR